MDNDQTINKYDRLRAGLEGDAVFTKPSTVQHVAFTGRAETFVIRTARAQQRGGDFILVECMDELGTTRIALPPKVADAIARQRESLTAKLRSARAKRVAKDRMAAGWVPSFKRKKKAS